MGWVVGSSRHPGAWVETPLASGSDISQTVLRMGHVRTARQPHRKGSRGGVLIHQLLGIIRWGTLGEYFAKKSDLPAASARVGGYVEIALAL